MKVHLVDGSFFPRERSATLAGENSGLGPESFEWTSEPTSGVTFYTDVCLEQACGLRDRPRPSMRVAWLLEPPWKKSHYAGAYALRNQFDFILTYWKDMPGYTLFYPLGGSWIQQEDWGLHDKSLPTSIIASEKRDAPGHQLRHEAIDKLGCYMDIWGRGYHAAPSKIPMLRPYRYSVVVESWRGNWYFSEKLIDCLSQGTIPIYWGCPDIGRFFNIDGIFQFETLDELGGILDGISKADYARRLDAVRDNLERARQYRCAEDWIYRQYPFLFEK